MLSPIICLTNTFPYKGEQFLRTELELLDGKTQIELWTFSPPESGSEHLIKSDSIYYHVFGKNNLKLGSKIKAAFLSIGHLFAQHEIVAAAKKRGVIRNLIKAIKFGYISELRIIQLSDWIHKTYMDEPNLIFYSYWMYEVAYVGARLKQMFPKCKFVTRCHRYDLYEEQHVNGFLPFRNFILKNADLVCPISENGEAYLQKLYGSEVKGKTYIARLGTVRKAAIPESKEKEDEIVLVSCSNLVEVKRIHLLIRALSQSKKPIHWYHFGDGELRASLEEKAKSLPKNVTYMFMGFRANEDIQRFYAEHRIDAFINVSRSEGVPVSVMEAESYGIPIIATDVGGTSEIVHDRENGVLLDVDFSDQELLDAIDNVLTHESEYSENAIHTWEAMSNACVVFPAFYKKLAEV